MTTLALPSLISAATPAEYIVIPLSRYPVIPLYRYIVIPLSPNPEIPSPPISSVLYVALSTRQHPGIKNTPLPMSGGGQFTKDCYSGRMGSPISEFSASLPSNLKSMNCGLSAVQGAQAPSPSPLGLLYLAKLVQ